MKKIVLSTIIMIISITLTGCNTSESSDANNQTANDQSSNEIVKISIEDAKKIALDDAKVKSDDVTFIKAESDLDNEVETYDVEFYSPDTEYDYEINAATGEIIEYDNDVEDFIIPNNQTASESTKISLEQAKDIALKHANLTRDKVNFIKGERDLDDGIEKYEIEFKSGNTEYDYEINEDTGAVIKYSRDVDD